MSFQIAFLSSAKGKARTDRAASSPTLKVGAALRLLRLQPPQSSRGQVALQAGVPPPRETLKASSPSQRAVTTTQ